MTTFNPITPCEYWSCDNDVFGDDIVCVEHLSMLNSGALDDCILCDQLKHVRDYICGDCETYSSYQEVLKFNTDFQQRAKFQSTDLDDWW